MTEIIPGAAYLSPSEKRVLYGYASRGLSGKHVLKDPGTSAILEYAEDIPDDLVLLYAPGDRIYNRVVDWNYTERRGIEIIHKTSQRVGNQNG